MEVHHHPQVGKKNFKEYFLEFLMIFLAVSMGFLAENIREGFVNRETGRRNIEMIVDNLKDDTQRLLRTITNCEKRVASLDRILSLQNENIDTLASDHFYELYFQSGNKNYFVSNDAAFEQMKSSGTIRFIKNKQVLDSLYKYSASNKRLYAYEDFIQGWYNAGTKLSSKFLDIQRFSILADGEAVKPSFSNALKYKGPDKADLALEFFNDQASYRMTLKGYLRLVKQQLDSSKRLVSFLEEQYHLSE